jgi:glutamyl-tRNA synthetase
VTAPRVRFAPSPTGMLHVGNARTALFDWLYARHTGGTCLLRIEDTDASRNHPEWVDVIYRSLEWLGLDWDEKPRFQSETFDAHRETAEKLHADGHAYYCDCTSEDVQKRNAEAGIKTPGYDSHCANRDLGPGEGRALRFRVPDEGTITRNDVIRGTTDIDLGTVEDFVIVRANGFPLYVFANALDDIADEITHVLRGEDHLSNVVKQILIRRALGHGEPVWAHLPMIVNDQRKKLSKRRDKVALESFRDDGIVAEAMVNYLATLGWNPPAEFGDELASLPGMVAAFDLDQVNSAPAAFDTKKLLSFNGFYLRRLTPEQFVDQAIDHVRRTTLDRLGPLIQERAATLDDAIGMIDFLFVADVAIDRATWDKVMAKDTAALVLDAAIAGYEALEDWTAEAIRAASESAAESAGLKMNKAQAPIRVAATGRQVGPPLFESLAVLGRIPTLERLRAARAQLP